MGQSNNREPRRLWKSTETRPRVPCASCGAAARSHAANLPFCDACLDWVSQRNLIEADERGAAPKTLRGHHR